MIEEQPRFLLTIITVVKNGERVLQQLINSIAKYKTSEVEFLVWDGKSTDRTSELVKLNANLIDQYICDSDTSIYDAMNKAVKHANGKFILFMGADDLLKKGFTEILPHLSDCKTIYYGGVIIGQNAICKPYSAYQLTKENVCHQAIIYPKSVFDKYEYDTKYKVFADFHLNLRCWTDPTFKTRFLNHIVAEFTSGGFSDFGLDLHYKRDKEAWFRTLLSPKDYFRYLNRKIGLWTIIREYLFFRRSHIIPEKKSSTHTVLMVYNQTDYNSDSAFKIETFKLIKTLLSQNFEIIFINGGNLFTEEDQNELNKYPVKFSTINSLHKTLYDIVKTEIDQVEFLWVSGFIQKNDFLDLAKRKWHIRRIFDLRGIDNTAGLDLNTIQKEDAVNTNSPIVRNTFIDKRHANVFGTNLDQIKMLFNNLR